MQAEFSLIDEMREVPGIMRRFDPAVIAPWLLVLRQKQKLLLTGEGSSRIFPAKNVIARALQSGNCPWDIHAEGARQAAEYALQDFAVIGASNSGRTRELIDLFGVLKAKQIPCLGMTATPHSKLTEISDPCLILQSGKENAVAASKTVVEQALVYQALLQGNEWHEKDRAADHCETILNQSVPEEITQILAAAPMLYFAGRNNGVAEELALKTNEITHKKSTYLEGTYVLHGIEEVMQPGEAVILIEPFPEEIDKIKQVLNPIGVKVIAIATAETPFPTIRIPALDGFDPYFQLLAGWNLLLAIGLHSGINLDQGERARKVGNAV